MQQVLFITVVNFLFISSVNLSYYKMWKFYCPLKNKKCTLFSEGTDIYICRDKISSYIFCERILVLFPWYAYRWLKITLSNFLSINKNFECEAREIYSKIILKYILWLLLSNVKNMHETKSSVEMLTRYRKTDLKCWERFNNKQRRLISDSPISPFLKFLLNFI